MTAPLRLVTSADVGNDRASQETVDVAVRHELELADGRRVLLLDDRGYGSTGGWNATTVAEVEFQVRTVVGPDEPFGERTASDMESDHWEALAARAREQGVAVAAGDLERLRHDVVVSERMRRLVEGP
jgi:hypothetical protein